MDNSNQSPGDNSQGTFKKTPWTLIVFIILVIIAIGFAWQYTGNKPAPVVVVEKPMPTPVIEPEPEMIVTEPVQEPEPFEIEEIVEEVAPVEVQLPSLDKSDDWLKVKLPEITWRKELLTLIVGEDMIRRFVVFTDNFAQGIVAYEHSPFILPKIKFSPEADSASLQNINGGVVAAPQDVLQWSESSSERFSLYVDLLRSMDSDTLVQWYEEIKPLVNEAYSELGYEDDFTNTLQDAITRVLDMELPKSSMALVHPSVMYKFADPELEALPDSDKLLLRLGKENLLVIKSILLEIHEKLAQQKNGVN
ncbi:DUF3014 domain-containing protein [Colwellia sp. 4_MG-2023]|uniref:DUF3014 domain-containing protein n=1 Tax=unclassified Colwellia TaxID=196834 RepID=UPI001C0A539A|nr:MULTISPECIES: DUF3014 domain-containing protein [unclassified Colwellia]MBU2925258.1 DUF3014 domain-containing protein [Colwellia sp. C2M11]MDO6486730.1 DUF3014 domain-containing protein [Colwellia sp. 6_MG-2023]MDO6506916.1 DUF3014 domain-containing protein [Colwellia sp. 5_MG-2023]MDO6556646.1 DUF3014 domain-containing protein [Colwellia sp. 4_MG-2023]MDO6651218.1 DUF3014 domain-containing protein [Colwellia sp. 3_MG-2023]